MANKELKTTVSHEDIEKAVLNIAGNFERTRTKKAEEISKLVGAEIYMKFENRQNAGSFKVRGALNCLLNLSDEQRKIGVVAMSAGNHAQGVSYHAGRLNIPVIIVMPVGTPYVKIKSTESFGAKVVLHGDLEQAAIFAQKIADEKGYTFIHPFDDQLVIAGQGTTCVEMLNDIKDINCLVIPIGGGGLISGVAIWAKHINPNIEIYGVQSSVFPSMKSFFKSKNIDDEYSKGQMKLQKDVCQTSTIAEGIAVKKAGRITSQIVKKLVDDVILVNEQMIERALVMILEKEKTLVEGAGAAALAGILFNKQKFTGKKVGIILSGGNIDQRVLAAVLMRDLVFIGRLGSLRIHLPDRPEVLSKVSGIIGELGGNIVEMTYQHIFSHASVKETSIEIAIETKDKQQFKNIITTLNASGYKTINMQLQNASDE